MKIVFNDNFYYSGYINDGASAPGRMEAIMTSITNNSKYKIVINNSADYLDIARVHESSYIDSVKNNQSLCDMAILSAGGAIKASQIAMESEPAFLPAYALRATMLIRLPDGGIALFATWRLLSKNCKTRARLLRFLFLISMRMEAMEPLTVCLSGKKPSF